MLIFLFVSFTDSPQKLDFVATCKFRQEGFVSKSRAYRKAEFIDKLKLDRVRESTTITYRHLFPNEILKASVSDDTCCVNALCKLYGISTKTLTAYKKVIDKGDAIEFEEMSEMRESRGEARKQNTLLWMKAYFHLMCDIIPTEEYTSKNYHLPKCISKISVFQEYKDDFAKKFEDDPQFKPYARSTFSTLWLENFPYVKIPESNGFSVCAHCAEIHDRILFASKSKDKVMLAKLQKIRQSHLDFVRKERLRYREHNMLAIDFPDSYESIVVDGMDQVKAMSPHFAGGALPKGMDCVLL
jgi:hypothetical protein